MKRLTPTEPKRELSLDELVEPTVVEEKAVEALANSKVYSSIKKLSSFKLLTSNYKMQTQKDIFVSDVRALLSHLDAKEHKLDVELLIEVLNACEEYFVYGKFSGLPVSTARESSMWVYKNGSEILSSVGSFIGSPIIINDGSTWSHAQTSGIVTLAVNDTLKLYGKMNTNSSTWSFVSGITETTLGAYRIGA